MKALFLVTTIAIVAAIVVVALRGPRFLRLWRAKLLDRRRPPAPRLPADRLETIVRELLARRGFRLGAPSAEGLALAHGSQDARLVVQVEASPPQERVPAERVRELAAEVERHQALAGILVTPYHIDRALAAEPSALLELIDGRGLLAAVDRELPHRARELRRYRLTGTEPAPSIGDGLRDQAFAS